MYISTHTHVQCHMPYHNDCQIQNAFDSSRRPQFAIYSLSRNLFRVYCVSVYVYICVCMYIYIYIYTHTLPNGPTFFTNRRMHMHMHMHIVGSTHFLCICRFVILLRGSYIHVRHQACRYICICTRAHTHKYTHTCLNVCMYVRIITKYARMHAF
jgi:hypothetical protein